MINCQIINNRSEVLNFINNCPQYDILHITEADGLFTVFYEDNYSNLPFGNVQGDYDKKIESLEHILSGVINSFCTNNNIEYLETQCYFYKNKEKVNVSIEKYYE